MPFARAKVVLLAAFVAVASASRAQASERVSLQWNAPEGCPLRAEVLAEVDRLLGDHAARPDEPLAVTATVRREGGGGHRVRLETPGASGPRVREIEAASCKTLGNTTALIIAMMIDPAAVSAASPAQANEPSTAANAPGDPADASSTGANAPGDPADASSTAANASATPTDDSSRLAGDASRLAGDSSRLAGDASRLASDPPTSGRASPPRAHGRPPLAIAVRALVARGSLPGSSFGVGAAGAIYFDALRIEAGAAIYLPARATPFPVLSTTGADFDLALATAAVCWEARIKRHIYVSPCFDLELGSLDGKSFGVTSPGEGAALWAAAGGGGRLIARPWRPVALTFGLDAVFPLQRPNFIVTALGSIYQPSWVAPRVSIGMELRL